MSKPEIRIKLKALQEYLERCLNESVDVWFIDLSSVINVYVRFGAIWQTLHSELPSVFEDFPVERPPGKIHAGSVFAERDYALLLLREIIYCLDIVSSLEAAEISTLRVTQAGVFFKGQYFDALQQVRNIFESAQAKIAIIDRYIDEKVLDILTLKLPTVETYLLTESVSPSLRTAGAAFNKQYGKLFVRMSNAFHDRFVVIDDKEYYHFGASIKDVGHRGFMFSRIEEPTVIEALKVKWAQEWSVATIAIAP